MFALVIRADFVPIIPIMIFVNTMGVLSFLLAMCDSVTMDYLSVAFFSVYISTFTSQVYILIKNLYTSVHFGKLIGIASMLGGVLSLSSKGLYDMLTMRSLKGNAAPVMWFLLAIICSAYLLLVPMYFAEKRKANELKSHRVLKHSGISSQGNHSKISLVPVNSSMERGGSTGACPLSSGPNHPERLITRINGRFRGLDSQ